MPEIVEQLVWPVTLLLVVVILRKPLGSLVTTTKRVKYKDLEVEFNEEIQKLSAEVTKALPASTPKETAEPQNVSIDLTDLADLAPNAAVVASWRSVEVAAKELLAGRGHNVSYDVATPYKQMQDLLVGDEIIDTQSGLAFEQLRRLRNKVVHADGFELSPTQAKEYIGLAAKLRVHLSNPPAL